MKNYLTKRDYIAANCTDLADFDRGIQQCLEILKRPGNPHFKLVRRQYAQLVWKRNKIIKSTCSCCDCPDWVVSPEYRYGGILFPSSVIGNDADLPF